MKSKAALKLLDFFTQTEENVISVTVFWTVVHNTVYMCAFSD